MIAIIQSVVSDFWVDCCDGPGGYLKGSLRTPVVIRTLLNLGVAVAPFTSRMPATDLERLQWSNHDAR